MENFPGTQLCFVVFSGKPLFESEYFFHFPSKNVQILLVMISSWKVSGNVYPELSRCKQTHLTEIWTLKIISYWPADKISSIYYVIGRPGGPYSENCDGGLENTFSSPASQFFTIRTDPKPVNNVFIFFLW